MTRDTATSAATKSQRINLRTSERQEALLRQAAERSHTSLSEFILGSAVEHAERVLADRRWFVATQAQYDDFVRLLDAPLPSTTKLERLFAKEPVFGKPFDLDG